MGSEELIRTDKFCSAYCEQTISKRPEVLPHFLNLTVCNSFMRRRSVREGGGGTSPESPQVPLREQRDCFLKKLNNKPLALLVVRGAFLN